MMPGLRAAAAVGVPLAFAVGCAPAAPAAPPAPRLPPALRAWIGEDPARGLRVLLEPLPAPQRPAHATVTPEGAVRAALQLPADSALFRVRVLAAAGEVPDAGLRWSSGGELLPPPPREGAGARQRLQFEGIVRGGGPRPAPRHYLVAGPAPDDSAAAALWLGADPPLTLAPRSWNSLERARWLDPEFESPSHD